MKIKKTAHRKGRRLLYCKRAFFSLLFLLISLKGLAQDSIPNAPDLTEEMELKFQQFFFKALSEKAIENYQKAIENLESCNQIIPNDIAVFFEFSKNHLELENTLLAKEYIERALKKDPENGWMQKHLAKILIKEKQYRAPKKSQQEIGGLHLKDSVAGKRDKEIKKIRDVKDIFKTFEVEKSFSALKHVLERSKENTTQLLKYSAEGILLFPAQPFVYLMHGKALNLKKEYSKAIETLKNGLDFVFEASVMSKFYGEIALSYQGLGNKKAAEEYRKKSEKIKN